MDTIADLIDRAKARTGANYTEIGERLDRSKQLVTNWRKGDKVPGDGDVMALARMAGENADRWLAIAQAARTDGEARERWQNIAKRLASTAALLALFVAPSLIQEAHASTLQTLPSSDPTTAAAAATAAAIHTRHYAKWPAALALALAVTALASTQALTR